MSKSSKIPKQLNSIKFFEDKKIRSVWDEKREEWYFSVVDIVAALTDSLDPRDYFKKMRKRDEELDFYVGTNCPHVEMKGSNNKLRSVLAGDTKQIFRIIQSIPSKKAEPFKQWLAQVGKERIDETVDPELAISRAVETYRRRGYPEDWINQRMLSISVRNELTDEWHKRGVSSSKEFAILTDEITKAWSDMTTREYKNYKGLKKESLRDNMTTSEIILNMLAEDATKKLSQKKKPDNLKKHKMVANRGGSVAKHARQELEELTGESVISSSNYKDGKLLK